MSSYLYNTVTKASFAYSGLLTVSALGIYNYGLRPLIYPFFLSSSLNIWKSIKKLPSCFLDDEKQVSSEINFLNKLRDELVNSNENFKHLKDVKMETRICRFDDNAASGFKTVTVGKNLINKANNDKDIKFLKVFIAHELGHLSEHHDIITRSYIFTGKLAEAAIYNFIVPHTKLDFFNNGKIGVMLGALVQKLVDLTLFNGINFIIGSVSTYIGRQLEYRADNAVVKSGFGKDFMKLLLEIKHKSPKQTTPSFLSSFSDEHPSIENRLVNLIKQDKLLSSKNSTAEGSTPSIFKNIGDFLLEQCLEIEGCAQAAKIFNNDTQTIIGYAHDYSNG